MHTRRTVPTARFCCPINSTHRKPSDPPAAANLLKVDLLLENKTTLHRGNKIEKVKRQVAPGTLMPQMIPVGDIPTRGSTGKRYGFSLASSHFQLRSGSRRQRGTFYYLATA